MSKKKFIPEIYLIITNLCKSGKLIVYENRFQLETVLVIIYFYRLKLTIYRAIIQGIYFDHDSARIKENSTSNPEKLQSF